MNMKTPALLTAVLLGATLAAAGLAQDDNDTRPGFGRGHGHAGMDGAFHGRRGPGMRPRAQARLFDRLDSDGDSLVSLEEFSAARLPEVDRVFERLDRDGNGLISAEERERPERPRRRERPQIDREAVIACVRETIADYDPPAAPDARFDLADTNGDGNLDLAELSAALDERAQAQFERLDADGDGFISLEEVQAHQAARLNLRRVVRACTRAAASPE